MQIFYTIQADQIEVGDQIVVDGDPIEVTFVGDNPEDINEVLVKGVSHETGDTVEYPLPFDYDVDVWGI